MSTTTSSVNTTATKERNQPSKVAQIYLFWYNVVQAFGWTYILYSTIYRLATIPQPEKSLWYHISVPMMIFQYAALLEILHAILGIVHTSVFLTFFQVLSRVGLVFVAGQFPETTETWFFVMMVLSWAITEVIRYWFYALKLPIINKCPAFLVWLRYTTFIVLYPTGVIGELSVLFGAYNQLSGMPDQERYKVYSISLPNAWNFSFYFYYLLIGAMAMYPFIFPQLYLHMFAQRRKTLGSSTKQKSA
jgi:very-long-chain (3R)-3-hydroxyacyl-CoA dehydratase